MNNLRIIVLGVLVSLISCKDKKEEKSITTAESFLEKIQVSDLSGNRVNLGEFRNKTIFLNVWATWCKPCLEEMPSIKNAEKLLENEKIVFLLASDESINHINKFTANDQYGFNYLHLQNPEELNIEMLPTTFIFDGSGNLAFSEPGKRQWDNKENIELLLKIIKGK